MSQTFPRGFKALLATQFFGALNDNTFKLLVIFLVLDSSVLDRAVLESAQTDPSVSRGTVDLVGALFVLPFVLFSYWAGFVSDRYAKSRVARWMKFAELVLMGISAFLLAAGHYFWLLPILFMMGTHSAFFSPSKYGLVPELVPATDVSRANGYLELLTFLPIIVGTIIGGFLSDLPAGQSWISGVVIVAIALLGLISSLWIGGTEPQSPSLKCEANIWRGTMSGVVQLCQTRELRLVALASAYFWFVAQLFQLNVPRYGRFELGLTSLETSLLLAVLGLGIGVGSIFAGRVSEGKVELGLVPIGSLMIAVGNLGLGLVSDNYLLVLLMLAVAGMGGGFFIVPLNSFVQANSPSDVRGENIAAMNLLIYAGMLISSLVSWLVLEVVGVSSSRLFLFVGVLALLISAYICTVLPQLAVRCLNWIITHTLYKVTVYGRENVPREGGALIVCNHVAYSDPPLILATLERNVSFLMFKPIFDLPFVNRVARIMEAIPISVAEGPKAVVESLRRAAEVIRGGRLAGIFAEGQLTRIGNMVRFGHGLERIMKDVDADIVPAYLDQMWGSVFSFRGGRPILKLPKEIPYPVSITYGEPMSGKSSAFQVRERIQELGAEAALRRRRESVLLHWGFLKRLRRRPWRRAVADEGRTLSTLEVAVAGLVLARRLAEIAGVQHGVDNRPYGVESPENIGILLPPSVAGVIANLGVMFSGAVPVNLNYTVGGEVLQKMCEKCGARRVLTSRLALAKLNEKSEFTLPLETIFIEDLLKDIKLSERIRCSLLALICPLWLLERLLACGKKTADSLATIIFSSGSTGEPKGVELTHGNISSNIEAIFAILQLQQRDCVVGILPFFHSFGFTGTLWLPLLGGIPVVYHFNPLDAKRIGELTAGHGGTILFSTPTFLLSFLRRVEPEQFATLRYVITGAEKLQEKLAEAFFNRFGIYPLEGYGCTELSPVAIVNVPDFEDGAVKQKGRKAQSVGHPLPGVAVRIVDPNTWPDKCEIKGLGEEGLMLIKGPNVMRGYLNDPERTAEVVRDGWYVTGDIARVDEDGFVTIVDRLSRFSKIGGEMVPHLKIEQAIEEVLQSTERVCAVVGVPDEKKGERLVVLHTISLNPAEVVNALRERELPNLWIPKVDDFKMIPSLPLLGSGKSDMRKLKEYALGSNTTSPPGDSQH